MPLLPSEAALTDDPVLVAHHLAGDEGAFAQIVARHQSVVCAVAFSACGNLQRSEEIAQETFVAAWRSLPSLREPTKLRGWLCGIARHLAHHASRRDTRTPTARAEPVSTETADPAHNPRENTIKQEEIDLLWHALEELPLTYREPLVLYYREQQSAAAVAAALELSEDVVRQRLTRGRALLSERIAAMIEETLVRSRPTAALTQAVLAALPLGTTTAQTAVATQVGALLAKGSAGAKAAATGGALPVVVQSLPAYWEFRAEYEAADNAVARRRILRRHVVLYLAIAVGVVTAVALAATGLASRHPVVYSALLALSIALPIIGVGAWQAKQRRQKPSSDKAASPTAPHGGFEYRSASTLFGLPLIHICVGGTKLRVAKGWIAFGGVALGGLFASGGFAIAPLSVGGCSLGLLAYGGIALGGLAIGGTAVGIAAVGGAALGWIAEGGAALSLHANQAFVAASRDHGVLHIATSILRSSIGAWSIAWLFPLVLILVHHFRHRRRTGLK